MITIVIHNHNYLPPSVGTAGGIAGPTQTPAGATQKPDNVHSEAETRPTGSAPAAAETPHSESRPATPAAAEVPASEPASANVAEEGNKTESKAPAATSEQDKSPEPSSVRKTLHRYIKPAIVFLLVLVAAIAAFFIWRYLHPKTLSDAFASGNGRIEAVELDVAAKAPGRIRDIYAEEGDSVSVGQIVARMDTDVLGAQLKQAQAQEAQARTAINTALAMVSQHESEQATARAVVAQREAAHAIAQKTLLRSEILSREHAASIEEYDDDAAREKETAAAVVAAKAQLSASQATVDAAQAQVLGARSNVAAIVASESQIQAEIDDTVLKAVRAGRIQFRIAQPGEVVAAGGKVLSMVDLSDVTMTFFLPEAAAGKIALGAEVHIVLDASPKEVIPATVSFVANVAQFTPKTVETKSERDKLVFRVKARIGAESLRQHAAQIKSGLPGVAYVRLDSSVPWPAELPSGTQQ